MADIRMLRATLDPDAVRRAIADIDGDGSAALDPDEIVGLGLPRAFVEPLIERTCAANLPELYADVVGSDTSIATVWSLALLRALADHYGLRAPESFYWSLSERSRAVGSH